jgi:DNA relaxase NicK
MKGFKPTRIDLAIDDYTKSLNWKQFDSAYDAGQAHGFVVVVLQLPKNYSDNGFTFYGSKGSDKLYRFYDKNKGVRWWGLMLSDWRLSS